MRLLTILFPSFLLLACNSSTVSKKEAHGESVQFMVDKEREKIQGIYLDALENNPKLQGEINVKFTIQPSGALTNVSVMSATIADQAFIRKLIAQVSKWRFPPTTDTSSIDVVYPFVFQAAR